MNDATRDNVNLKREYARFINRFFYNKERNTNTLAELYFLMDDLIAFYNNEQLKIGNEMLDAGFKEEFLVDRNIKVYLDEELQSVLIDEITKKEHDKLVDKANKAYLLSLAK